MRSLGVDLGEHFWGDFNEEFELARQLRLWWDEPRLVETATGFERQEWLASWIKKQEQRGGRVVGGKHPLLSMCCYDTMNAWGDDTIVVWSRRELQASIASLERCRWGWNAPDQIQTTLWNHISDFNRQRPVLAVDYEALVASTESQVRSLLDHLQLTPTESEFVAACEVVRAHTYGLPKILSSSKTVNENAQQRPHKIVATMLSGNSESLVAEAVQSAIDLVDEWLLIDTGISDRTSEIVRSIAGEKFVNVQFRWINDFAAAGNFALQAADQRGATWAMTVDSDERFVFPDSFTRQTLDELLHSDENVMAWMLSTRDGDYSKERFVRIPSGLEWKGRTHEALTGFVRNDRKVMKIGCFWEPPKSAEGHQHKLKRDLAILIDEVEAKPLDPRWWYYLGQTYEGLREYANAVAAYHKCASLDGWPAESASAFYRIATCHKELRQYREAETQAAMGLSRVPRSSELLWMAGFCAYQQGALQRAIEWCEQAIHCGEYFHPEPDESRLRLTLRYRPADFEAPFDVLRYAYQRTNQNEKASWAELHFNRAKKLREVN